MPRKRNEQKVNVSMTDVETPRSHKSRHIKSSRYNGSALAHRIELVKAGATIWIKRSERAVLEGRTEKALEIDDYRRKVAGLPPLVETVKEAHTVWYNLKSVLDRLAARSNKIA